jgi:hypothetical protein
MAGQKVGKKNVSNINARKPYTTTRTMMPIVRTIGLNHMRIRDSTAKRKRGRSMRSSYSQRALASQCSRPIPSVPSQKRGQVEGLEFGHSESVNPEGCQRVAGGRRGVFWGGDLRATAQEKSCTPAGVPDPAGWVTRSEGLCRCQVVAVVRSARFWHPSPWCPAIRRRFPVVVPPLPQTTTGYPLPTAAGWFQRDNNRRLMHHFPCGTVWRVCARANIHSLLRRPRQGAICCPFQVRRSAVLPGNPVRSSDHYG